MKDLFKSPYNAFRADIYDTLPYHWYNWGMGGECIRWAVRGGTISIGASVWVKVEKDKWEQQQSLSVDEEKTSGTGGGK